MSPCDFKTLQQLQSTLSGVIRKRDLGTQNYDTECIESEDAKHLTELTCHLNCHFAVNIWPKTVTELDIFCFHN